MQVEKKESGSGNSFSAIDEYLHDKIYQTRGSVTTFPRVLIVLVFSVSHFCVLTGILQTAAKSMKLKSMNYIYLTF